MSQHPVEALLRPPVELWSTLVAFATAAIAILAPWALMMPPISAAKVREPAIRRPAIKKENLRGERLRMGAPEAVIE